MRHRFAVAWLLFVWIFAGSSPSALAFTVPPNDGFLTDTTGKLSEPDEGLLEQELAAYRQQSGKEIAVVMVPTLGGELALDVADQIARKWGVGGRDRPNGAVILYAYDDRVLTILPGKGLEDVLPEDVVLGIIEEDATPAFRDGQYAEGLRNVIMAMQKHISGEYTSKRYAPLSVGGVFLPFIAFLLCAVFSYVAALRLRSQRLWAGAVVAVLLGIAHAWYFGWMPIVALLAVIGIGCDMVMRKGAKRRRRVHVHRANW